MAYEKKIWVDVPNASSLTKEQLDALRPEKEDGTKQDALCRFDAANMNRIENGIVEHIDDNIVHNKSNEGGAFGIDAEATEGGAVGYQAKSSSGGAIGYKASTTTGAAVGSQAETTNGGAALGSSATATTGGAAGVQAKETAGGGAVGYQALSTSGGAVGSGAKAESGGAVGKNASSGYGGAVGDGAKSDNGGGAVGYQATTDSGGAAIGREAQAPAGSFAGGYKANAVLGGGAVGSNAKVVKVNNTIGGGAVGSSACAHAGGAVGAKAEALGSGGAVGANTATTSGASVGANATSTTGGAVGANTSATSGFSGGNNAKATADAIQLGEGHNDVEKTLQIYDHRLMNADGSIPSQRMFTLVKSVSVNQTFTNYGSSAKYSLDISYIDSLKYSELEIVFDGSVSIDGQTPNSSSNVYARLYCGESLLFAINQYTMYPRITVNHPVTHSINLRRSGHINLIGKFNSSGTQNIISKSLSDLYYDSYGRKTSPNVLTFEVDGTYNTADYSYPTSVAFTGTVYIYGRESLI